MIHYSLEITLVMWNESIKRISGFALHLFLFNALGYGLILLLFEYVRSDVNIMQLLFMAVFFGLFMSLGFTPVIVFNLNELGLKSITEDALRDRTEFSFQLENISLEEILYFLNSKDSGILKAGSVQKERDEIVCYDTSFFGKYDPVRISLSGQDGRSLFCNICLDLNTRDLIINWYSNIKRFDKIKNILLTLKSH